MADSGSCTAGTSEVIRRKIRIRIKGAHATRASFAVIGASSPAADVVRYSSGIGVPFLIRHRAIRTPRQMTEPITSGSCGPTNFAVRNSGTTKETAAAAVMPKTPFSAFGPPPKIMIIKNGEIRNSRHSMVAIAPQRGRISTPETALRVIAGTPTEPNAVGMALITRQATMVFTGSKPRATRIPAGIATAVPKPAMPSIK